MPSPKISVIVPVYNAEKWLRRCVDSILAQTFTDFELLLIDDGSTDGSGVICDEYVTLDIRVRVFHKPNGGVGSARNIGLDNARGEWITFADADDYVTNKWLSNYRVGEVDEADIIQQGAKSDRLYWSRGTRNECGFNFDGDPITYLKQLSEQDMMGYPWMKLYRGDIIRQNNLSFDPRIHFQEDELFFFTYLTYCRRVKSYNAQGYFYLVPDWNKKYHQSVQESLYLGKCLVDKIETLLASEITSGIVRINKDCYTQSLMRAFACSPKLEYLKEIRRLHLKDYQCTRLKQPLKWLICHDNSMLFSWIALLIHTNLRKQIHHK